MRREIHPTIIQLRTERIEHSLLLQVIQTGNSALTSLVYLKLRPCVKFSGWVTLCNGYFKWGHIFTTAQWCRTLIKIQYFEIYLNKKHSRQKLLYLELFHQLTPSQTYKNRNFSMDREPRVWWHTRRTPKKQRSHGVLEAGTLKYCFAIALKLGLSSDLSCQYFKRSVLWGEAASEKIL